MHFFYGFRKTHPDWLRRYVWNEYVLFVTDFIFDHGFHGGKTSFFVCCKYADIFNSLFSVTYKYKLLNLNLNISMAFTRHSQFTFTPVGHIKTNKKTGVIMGFGLWLGLAYFL